ncbi:hypothetical protein TNCT_386961 [Trichonephila clavata]|uniref:Uncharacterized protein n=1 Tax=Trichonephila clavata TaxID=2740835 RepID=A0A8X6H6C7_TRICU|nr:hypothetical protein TNCT_386961 [Trichonephila clavata]
MLRLKNLSSTFRPLPVTCLDALTSPLTPGIINYEKAVRAFQLLKEECSRISWKDFCYFFVNSKTMESVISKIIKLVRQPGRAIIISSSSIPFVN